MDAFDDLPDLEDDEDSSLDWSSDFGSEFDSDLGGDGDSFDALREKSARASGVYDDMEFDVDDDASSSGGGFLNSLSPGQRLIVVLLVLVDVIVVGIGFILLLRLL